MPEPDFAALALRIAGYFNPDPAVTARDPYVVLKEVWNARGAADLAAIQGDWAKQIAPYEDSGLLELIRKQDR